MKKTSAYHHGNLKNELIEEGIKTINEVGESGLSLRKIAIKCGVSNAAPYAHFANKEELISAMQQHVTEEFMHRLKKSVLECQNADTMDAIMCIGREYVRFFMENPHYFKFLYSSKNDFLKINLNLNSKDNYPPFEYLKDSVIRINKNMGIQLSDREQEFEVLKLWIAVQGFTSIAILKNVEWDCTWEDSMNQLLFGVSKND